MLTRASLATSTGSLHLRTLFPPSAQIYGISRASGSRRWSPAPRQLRRRQRQRRARRTLLARLRRLDRAFEADRWTIRTCKMLLHGRFKAPKDELGRALEAGELDARRSRGGYYFSFISTIVLTSALLPQSCSRLALCEIAHPSVDLRATDAGCITPEALLDDFTLLRILAPRSYTSMADLTTTVWLSSQPPPPLGFLPLSANSSLQTTSLNTPTQPPLHSLEALYYHAESQQGSRSVVLDNLPKLPPSLSPAAPADQLTAAPVVHSASSTLAWNSPPATARPSRAASSRPAAPASALAAVASPSPTAAPSFREDISTRLLKRWEGEHGSVPLLSARLVADHLSLLVASQAGRRRPQHFT